MGTSKPRCQRTTGQSSKARGEQHRQDGTFNLDGQTLTASEGETAAESTEGEVPDIISFQTTANLLDEHSIRDDE
jgi:hypothetical protein